MQFLAETVLGNVVERKDIDKNTVCCLAVFRQCFRKYSAEEPYFSESVSVPGICLHSLQKEPAAVQFLLTYTYKPIIIFSCHAEIHVFIPRNKAPVTYCPEQSAGDHKVRNVMLST